MKSHVCTPGYVPLSTACQPPERGGLGNFPVLSNRSFQLFTLRWEK